MSGPICRNDGNRGDGAAEFNYADKLFNERRS